jgi:hypothetical protein
MMTVVVVLAGFALIAIWMMARDVGGMVEYQKKNVEELSAIAQELRLARHEREASKAEAYREAHGIVVSKK